jgi:hypothetical protein
MQPFAHLSTTATAAARTKRLGRTPILVQFHHSPVFATWGSGKSEATIPVSSIPKKFKTKWVYPAYTFSVESLTQTFVHRQQIMFGFPWRVPIFHSLAHASDKTNGCDDRPLGQICIQFWRELPNILPGTIFVVVVTHHTS